MRTVRMQHTFKVDPNDVRSLPTGTCYLISQGKAAKIRVTQAPETPEPQLPDPDAGARDPATPTELADTPLRP